MKTLIVTELTHDQRTAVVLVYDAIMDLIGWVPTDGEGIARIRLAKIRAQRLVRVFGVKV